MTLGDVLGVWDWERQNFLPKVPLHGLLLDKMLGTLGQAAFSTTVNLQPIYPNKGQHGEREIHGKQMNKQDQLWWGGGDPVALLHDTDLRADCARVELTCPD